MKTVLAALILALFTLPAHAGLFGGGIDDDFTVKTLDGKTATLEGQAKTLKEGDLLYFVRSPYNFTITAVKGNTVTIALPEKQDLKVGNVLSRKETDQIKKAIETEKKLKQALEE